MGRYEPGSGREKEIPRRRRSVREARLKIPYHPRVAVRVGLHDTQTNFYEKVFEICTVCLHLLLFILYNNFLFKLIRFISK